jgi:hypothetical protein
MLDVFLEIMYHRLLITTDVIVYVANDICSTLLAEVA